MLATAAIRNLLQNTKIERTLGCNLLPANNNPSFLDLENVSTVTVVDDSKNLVPVAFGLFHRVSANQVYCSVVTLKREYEDTLVILEKIESDLGIEQSAQHACYKIAATRDTAENIGSMPQYYTAFADQEYNILHQCVVDRLIDQTIGHKNMDMKRNITVDLYDTHSGKYAEVRDELWRDRDGFIVADKYRFNEIEISRANLCNLLQKAERDTTLVFEPLNSKTSAAFLEYDTEVAAGDRSEYLEYLFQLNGAKGTVALDASKRPVGYVLSLGNHILQCYGESAAIASGVFHKHVSQMIEPNLTMFTRIDNSWISKDVVTAASAIRRIRRFHSRVVPSSIKWSKVFALNIGTHLY